MSCEAEMIDDCNEDSGVQDKVAGKKDLGHDGELSEVIPTSDSEP